MNRFFNRIKFRLTVAIAALWLTFSIVFTASGYGVFVSKISNGVANYNTIEEKELKKDLPMTGTLYGVYEIVAYYETETTNRLGQKSVTTDYYYAVPFEENVVLIVKTRAGSPLDEKVYALLEACYDEGDAAILETGVRLDGVLKPVDSEVVNFTVEAFKQSDIPYVKVLPFTYDCSKPISYYIGLFWLGIALSVSFVGAFIFFIYKLTSSKKTTAAQGVTQIGAYTGDPYANRITDYDSAYNSASRSQTADNNNPYSYNNNYNSRQQNFVAQSQARDYIPPYSSNNYPNLRQQNFVPQSQASSYHTQSPSNSNSVSRQQNFAFPSTTRDYNTPYSSNSNSVSRQQNYAAPMPQTDQGMVFPLSDD